MNGISSISPAMNQWRFFAVAFVLVLASCKPEEAPKAPAAPEVLVTAAGVRDVPIYREWIGTLDGSENAQVRARVTGHIIKRDYQEGALVNKGDILFEIDARPFEAALLSAKGHLAEAKATQVATQAEADRSKVLFAKKVISEKEYINKLQLNIANVDKIDAQKAEVEEARLHVEFCKVTSPVDGIAGLAKAQVGDLVGTASNPELTSVSVVDPIKAVLPMPEPEYLAVVQRIQDMMTPPLDERPELVELILADGSVFPYKAKLLSVDLSAKASTGTILVTVIAPNPGNVLRPGFFVRARIVAETLKDAVVVPQRAVNEVQGSYQLGIIGPDGKAEIRPVKVGDRSGADWVITSGLQPGESVVVEGLQKIKAGMQVEAKPWRPAAQQTTTEPEVK